MHKAAGVEKPRQNLVDLLYQVNISGSAYVIQPANRQPLCASLVGAIAVSLL